MIKKITTGFVIQDYNDKGDCVGQIFIAGNPVDYEHENGESLSSDEHDIAVNKENYQSFDMVQPNTETCEKESLRVVQSLWADFGNIIVDEDDNIEQGWKHFSAGTSKIDIWRWIEKEYNVFIAEDLMNSITE